jgi:MFS-type transporter involved in bile tolerance (Atg22 family)
LMEYWTGSIRYSVLAVGFFFVLGLLSLLFVPKEEKIQEDKIPA